MPPRPVLSSRSLRLLGLVIAGFLPIGGIRPAASAQGAVTAPQQRRPPQADTTREAELARADRGRIRGRDGALWIIVISDFQCPFCQQWHEETAPRIERDYVRTGKAQIAYVNYPIVRSHPNAMAAHEAAMCAAEQGQFWPMADALFATQSAWKAHRSAQAYFDSLAGTIRLDRARQRRCIRDGHLRPLIEADIDRSLRSGVGSTPTFFIGDQVMIGAQPYEAFRRAIDSALAAAQSRPAR